MVPLTANHNARLIPACAGKTSIMSSSPSGTRAHPRVCGENFICFAADVWAKGSSPRVRGKRDALPLGAVREGLIPACAGKTGERRA